MKKLNKNILIISKSQFGYNYNSVSLFNILLENNIYFCYLGYNEGKKNYSLVSDYYELIEVSFSKSKLLNNIKFFITIIKTLNRYEIIYVFYFYGCSILKLIFPKKKFILDIRTGSIFKGSLKKYLANKLLKFESKFFDKLSIISESLLRKLEIKNKNVKIVPVIPHKIKFIKRNFDEIYLLYVGTLKNRNIIDTVLGLYNLITKHPDYSNIIKNYRIVCDNGDELTELKKLINELKLNDKILVFD
ncbi:MAG: hypothetical protein N2114_01215, partial [Candidatus Goldbacteria bacterium]|nr:hypothetical protein [Candidatus Goldiibacteriota bacterium]